MRYNCLTSSLQTIFSDNFLDFKSFKCIKLWYMYFSTIDLMHWHNELCQPGWQLCWWNVWIRWPWWRLGWPAHYLSWGNSRFKLDMRAQVSSHPELMCRCYMSEFVVWFDIICMKCLISWNYVTFIVYIMCMYVTYG